MCDTSLIETLMSDRFYLMVASALNHLPEFKNRLDCRKFFDDAKFRQAIPINSAQA